MFAFLFLIGYLSVLGTAGMNSSGGLVVRASALGAVDLGFISSRVILNLVFVASLFTLSIKATVCRASRQVYLLCRWEGRLAGFPHLISVIDR